jgi:hypothetical protein
MLAHSQFQVIQITLVFVTGALGITTGCMLNVVRHNFFHGKCHYFVTNLTVSKTLDTHGKQKADGSQAGGGQGTIVEVREALWSSDDYCYYIDFEGIVVFLFSSIWLWFYVHMENIIYRYVFNVSIYCYFIDS